MSIIGRPLLFVVVSCLWTLLIAEAQAQPAGSSGWIVVLEDSVAAGQVAAKAAVVVGSVKAWAPSLTIREVERRRDVAGRSVTAVEPLLFRRVFRGFVVDLDEKDLAELDRLRAHPDVAFVSEDADVEAFSQFFLPGMQRIRARSNATARINDVRDVDVDVDIAILDTGIDPTHPDLNVHESVSFVSGDPGPGDPNGHGTHVAGIAAAIDDASGVHGVAPGARLWAVKVLGASGSGSVSTIIEGLEYVIEHADEIEVVNLSLGGIGQNPEDGNCGLTYEDALHLAICKVVHSGIVVVVAAGNWRIDSSLFFPARYDEVITVSAVTELDGEGPNGSGGAGYPDNALWGSSNFGIDVDIAAPGALVLSTLPDGQYGEMSGTSMAAPHVAGAAALWIVENGRPRNAAEVQQVRDELVRLAFPQKGFDNGFTHDAENYAEPLLDVGAIDLIAGDPLEPQLFSDRDWYTFEEDCPALFGVVLADEVGEPVVGLPSNGFIPYLNGEQVEADFRELGEGTYLLAVDVSKLWPRTYDFHVVTQNAEGFARTGGLVFGIRTRDPGLVINRLEPARPVISPDSPSQTQYFFARVTDGSGNPAIPSNGAYGLQLQSSYDGGDPPFFLLSWAELTYGGYDSTAVSTAGLALGTYTLHLQATLGEATAKAFTSFEYIVPDPALTAMLTANTSRFDFTQSIPPQNLFLALRLEDEFQAPVSGLLSELVDPITVSIDGQQVASVDFAEEDPGIYTSTGIDLSGLSHGSHGVSVSAVDTRGLEAVAKLEIEVVTLGPVLEIPLCTCREIGPGLLRAGVVPKAPLDSGDGVCVQPALR